MYTVEVMPIQRGVLKDSLTFFSRDEVTTGSVVSAPIRKRMVPSLVLACTDVRDGKLDLKAQGFALKKLGTATPRVLFSPALMRAVTRIAQFFVAEEGTVLAQLIFTPILTSPRSLTAPTDTDHSGERVKPDVLVLQAELPDRVQAYKNLVRESFARGRSVMLLAPTLVEVEALAEALQKGIEDRVVVATGMLGHRALRAAWEKVATATEPIVLVGTPTALSFPIKHLDALIVERESARSYVLRTRPQLDLRRAAEFVAEERGVRLILADFPLRVETYARVRDQTADDWSRPQVRTQSPAGVTIFDVRKTDKTQNERRHFTALQDSTYEALAAALTRGGRAVVFAARRGIAPLTVCNDCGTPVTDAVTDTPMTLHKTPRGNVFMSHRTGAVELAERACVHCGGWNLVSLGLGVDRVYDEVVKRMPEAKVLLCSADTTPTHKAAIKLCKEFYKTPRTILVGTERMLPYISTTVDTAIVASIDSMLSLSAWRAHEHALSVLYQLVRVAEVQCIVETRRPSAAVMKSFATGTPMEFLRDELKERHTYGYPPFKTFVGVRWSGTEAQCTKIRDTVVPLFKDHDVVGPLPPEIVDRNRYVERMVVRVPRGTWPDERLSEILRSLPLSVTIAVDPDEIV